MSIKDIDSLRNKVRHNFGSEYILVGYNTRTQGVSHWKLLQKFADSSSRFVDTLRVKNEDKDRVDSLKIESEDERVIGIKNKGHIYYASDYYDKTIALKNTMNGSVVFVAENFRFASKKSSASDNKSKEKGIIKVV